MIKDLWSNFALRDTKEIISSHTSPPSYQGPNTLLSHQRNHLDSLQQSLMISLSTSLHSCFFFCCFCFFNSATVLLCKFWLTVKHCDIRINTYAGKKNNCLLGIHYTLISRPAVRNKYLCLTWQIKHWSYFFINPHRQIVNIFRMEYAYVRQSILELLKV